MADELTMLASAHGVVGDGVTDDGAALDALLVTAAAAGKSVTLTGGSVVKTTATITIPSGTRLHGNGATLSNYIDGSVANGEWFPTVQLNRVDTALIEDLVIDGRKAAVSQETAHRHGIKIKSSTNVTIRRVTSKDNKGDGIYIGGDDWLSTPDTRGTYSEHVLLEDVTSVGNHRQGISITSAKDVRLLRGTYSDQTNAVLPASGVDVEPNYVDDVIEDLVFEDAKFNGNAGSGIIIDFWNDSVTQFAPTVRGCEMRNNANYGLVVPAVDAIVIRRLLVENATVVDNGKSGVAIFGSADSPRIIGGQFLRNGDFGICINPFSGRTVTNVLISGATVLDNSQTTPGAVDGIRIEPNPGGVLTKPNVIHTRSGGATQRWGIHTTAGTSGWRIEGCDLSGNATGESNWLGTADYQRVPIASPNGSLWFISVGDSGAIVVTAR